MFWSSDDQKAGSYTANNNIYPYDEEIEAFFIRNGFDGATRDACDEYARVRFPDSAAKPAATQGYCSYTLNISDEYLLQFRPEAFMLDIDTCRQVKSIYGEFAPATTYLGEVEGISLQRVLCANARPSAMMHVYLHQRIRGVPLSEFRKRKEGCRANDDKMFKRRLMSGLAKIFALGFRGRQPSRGMQGTLPAGSMIKGRVGKSMRWRLNLLNGLPEKDLLAHVSEAQAQLDWVEASSWGLTHGDLLPGNMMVDAETGHLTGLIDWAEAEWLPFGMALYGVEEVLGEDRPCSEGGFRYFDDHEELRRVFWDEFLSFIGRDGIMDHHRLGLLREAGAARKLGILLWRGIAFDDGKMDRVVEVGRDDSEIQKLRLFLEAHGVLACLKKRIIWSDALVMLWLCIKGVLSCFGGESDKAQDMGTIESRK
ncbi:hypothetical protein TRIATDRAFT_321380 [Trichoderma atroviride IMI 206040]|uniref:Aminoglycoside phosphotransferase domain-containing protein n=1 Tax=Hypocrea atroviridis (strain ATCC 20476 / IMI 206040) TaxID=452589 RepID=G9P4C5_HYPAI|nr:uncharacterized protein TRIATDRAFT_321380 [Trichoderma atroviride IMI 206040]EHK41126.1 hypothetical protein TRIATDRAFT_321380 [Trichoderma atroviride IMI 206040]